MNSASSHNFNLLTDTTAGNGCQIQFKNEGAGVATINRAGSDTLASGGSTSLTSLALSQGDAGALTADGVSNGIWWWTGSRHYDSGQQTITSGGSLTLAHGLGVQPSNLHAFLHNTTAEGGYSIGDEPDVSSQLGNGQNSGSGVAVVPDATSLNVRFGSLTGPFSMPRKDTGASFVATNGNWKFILRAYVNN